MAEMALRERCRSCGVGRDRYAESDETLCDRCGRPLGEVPTTGRCDEDGAFGGNNYVGRCVFKRGHFGECEFEWFGEANRG